MNYQPQYERLADEELLTLAANRDDLLEEAALALHSEMRRRGLQEQPIAVVEVSEFIRERPAPRRWQLFHRRHGIYAANTRLLVRIVMPAAVLGGAAVLLTLFRGRELLAHGFRLEAAALQLAGVAMSFVINVFAFGAIATAIDHISAGDKPTVADCYALVRARWGVIAVLALPLCVLAALAEFGAMAVTALFFFFAHRTPLPIILGASYVVLALGLTVTATYSLSVPITIFEDTGVKGALQRSDYLTRNSFGTTFLLVAEALVSGYLGAMLPYWAAELIARRFGWAPWANWAVWAASIAGVAMADVVLLIGLSLIYLDQCGPPTGSEMAAQPLKG